MAFQWSLSDSMSLQVSSTLLSIQVDLNNAVGGMISGRPLNSKSFSLYINLLLTIPSAPITIGIIVIFMFHGFFFNFLSRSKYSSFFSPSFSFTLWSARTVGSLFFLFFFFFFWLSLNLVVWLRLDDPFLCQNPREFWSSHFPGRILVCAIIITIIIIIIIIIINRVFHTSSNLEFSLKSKRRQVSSLLQETLL